MMGDSRGDTAMMHKVPAETSRSHARRLTAGATMFSVLLASGLVTVTAHGQTPPAIQTSPLAPPAAPAPGVPAITPAPPAGEPAQNAQPTPSPQPPAAPPTAGNPAAPAPVPAPTVPTPPPGPSFAGLPTLVAPSPNPADMDEVALPQKPALATEGQAIWDEGFQVLRDAFGRLLGEARRAGLEPAGKPLARFIDTNDEGFKFEALLPLQAAPVPGVAIGGEFRAATTPAGRAMRFVHKAPYDQIDSTYEAITAYLDARNVVVEDSFTEEYVADMTNAADPELEINIYVVPKQP